MNLCRGPLENFLFGVTSEIPAEIQLTYCEGGVSEAVQSTMTGLGFVARCWASVS